MYKHILIHLIGTEIKEFPSWEAFLSWKQSEEALSTTRFVQPRLYQPRVLSNLRANQGAVPRSKVDNYKLIKLHD